MYGKTIRKAKKSVAKLTRKTSSEGVYFNI